ncbi:unnamed protein product, partial [Rotaria sp. Silwood1]
MAKERFDELTIDRGAGHVTERKSCGFDEKFQVEYQTRKGQHVT